MLAALLLNLSDAPAPPPPAVAPARFGGGPFWRKKWRLDDDEEEREEVVADVPIASPVARAAVARAVQAIREEAPERVVIDAETVYARAMRALDADIDATRIERQWEREVRRRLREAERQAAEDEEIMIVSLLAH